jgi:hypothetical protein
MNINDNGRRLLDITNHTQEHHECAKQWHTETKTEIRQLYNSVSDHFQAIKKLHRNAGDDIHQVEIDIRQHHSEAKQRAERKLKYIFNISHFQS